MLDYHKTTEEEKLEICEWKYVGEYAIYNLPSYEEQIAARRGLANPRNCFYSFCDGKKLIGYINLVEEESGIFFGIAVHPDCCNQGYGQKMTRLGRVLSHQLYSGKPLYLEVRTWNTRAVKCYEKAGFRIVGEPVVKITSIGEGSFYQMAED